jgi:hypothetical protein
MFTFLEYFFVTNKVQCGYGIKQIYLLSEYAMYFVDRNGH